MGDSHRKLFVEIKAINKKLQCLPQDLENRNGLSGVAVGFNGLDMICFS